MASATVLLSLVGATDVLAADKGGTSDPYAIAELVWTKTGKALKKARKTKTKTIKKTLAPEWNEQEVTWSSITEEISELSLKVTVFDADMMSSTTLGGCIIPLSSFSAHNFDKPLSFALQTLSKMKEDATGSIEFYCRVESLIVAEKKKSYAAVESKEDKIVDMNLDSKTTLDSKEQLSAMMSTVWVTILGAEGLLAADKGGSSDPYATAELVWTETGKSLQKARKTKTKTIKKTLAPTWNENEVEWGNIKEDISELSLRVTVFDADMLSSTVLGGVLVSLTSGLDTENAYALQTVGSMKSEATGTIALRLCVNAALSGHKEARDIKEYAAQAKDDPSSTVWVTMVEAEGLLAADKGGSSDPYATAELVWTETGKSLQKARKTKTKTIKKTLAPTWNENEVEWGNIKEDISELSLRVTVFDADMLSSTVLGGVLVSLTSGLDTESAYALQTVGSMKSEATGTVTFRMRIDDAAAFEHKSLGTKVNEQLGSVWITLCSATNLLAADKGGTSDPYAIAELIYSNTGKPLKRPTRKTKTKTIKKSLHPIWDEEKVHWKDISSSFAEISLRVTVYDADLLTSTKLGGFTVPLSSFSNDVLEEVYSFPLEMVKGMKEQATGALQLRCHLFDPIAAEEEKRSRIEEVGITINSMIRLLEDQDIENKQREKEEKEAQAKEEAARLAVEEKAAELRGPDWKCEVCARFNLGDVYVCWLCNAERGREQIGTSSRPKSAENKWWKTKVSVPGEDDYLYRVTWYDGQLFHYFDLEDHLRNSTKIRAYRAANEDDRIRPRTKGTKIEFSIDEGNSWRPLYTVVSSCKKNDIPTVAGGHKIGDVVYSKGFSHSSPAFGSVMPRSRGTVKGPCTDLSLSDADSRVCVRFRSGLLINVRLAQISSTQPNF